MIEVVRPGLLDLVMDLGRPGYRAQGVPEGGAADFPALVLANRLLGNPDGTAGLELLLKGPLLRFPLGARIVLSGADMDAHLNGNLVARGQILDIPPGGMLEVGIAQRGLRGYVAFAGGIDVPEVLGSRSTFLQGGFGGWQGRALKAGDILPLGVTNVSRNGSFLQSWQLESLRVIPGPQLAGFDDSALQALTEGEYSVSPDSNRLGLRMLGSAMVYSGKELASQALLPGALQVPPDGQPIIMGWDGPVTGGYPVIAGIIEADLPGLAQLRPGEKVRFRIVNLEEAQSANRQTQETMNGAIKWDA